MILLDFAGYKDNILCASGNLSGNGYNFLLVARKK